MYSLLIVDDEYYIRVRVRKCVNWPALGFEVVEDCESGAQALALMRRRAFDLVVLDISMPVMDGLTLCREIRARGDAAQLIILTGYDKFEYAKSALACDVVDYILKPVDGQEVESAVKKALERIQKSAEMKARARRAEADIFFSRVLVDAFPAQAELAVKMAEYGVAADRLYVVADFEGEAPPEPTRCLRARLPLGSVLIVEARDERELARAFEANGTTAGLTLGLSEPCAGTPEGLRTAYMQAGLTFCQRLMKGDRRLFCYRDMSDARNLNDAAEMNALREAFAGALRQRDAGRARAALRQAFDRMAQRQNTVFGLHIYIEGVLQDIQKYRPFGQYAWDDAALVGARAFDLMRRSETLDELAARLAQIAERGLAHHPSVPAANAGALLVERVRRLVRDRYMECDLTPGSIAQTLSLNASYLSDTFSRFAGQTMIQLITQTRMEKARELLSQNAGSLTEVMQQVGYRDPYYFSKRFKKYFGYPPSACRRE